MDFIAMRTIKREVPPSQVISAMERRFRHEGEMVKMPSMLRVRGFNKGLGGINYRVVADFVVRAKDGKTSIHAGVNIGPSRIFWLLVIGGFFMPLRLLFFIVVGMYFLRKKRVASNALSTIDQGLSDVADELGRFVEIGPRNKEAGTQVSRPVMSGQASHQGGDMWNCRECGTQNLSSAKTCEQCGAYAPGKSPAEKMPGAKGPQLSGQATREPVARPAVSPAIWVLVGVLAVPAVIWGWLNIRGQMIAAEIRREEEAKRKLVADAISIAEKSKLYRKWTQHIRVYAEKKGIPFHAAQDQMAEIGMKSFRLFPHCDYTLPDGVAVFPKEKLVILGAVVQRQMWQGQNPCDLMGDYRIRVQVNNGFVGFGYVPAYRGAEWKWTDMNE